MNSSQAHTFIFLAGVHGVGKSSLCREVFEPEGFYCVSASSIIKNADGEVSKTKQVGDVHSNQQKLIEGINRLKSLHQRFVVDGHFALLKPGGDIECLDAEVYRALSPDLIIVLKADPNLISSRLKLRDETIWTSTFIAEFQDREIAHGRQIALQMSIPLYVISTSEELIQLLPAISSQPQYRDI